MENEIVLTEKETSFLEKVQEKINKGYEEIRKGMVDEKAFTERINDMNAELKQIRENSDSKKFETAIENISKEIGYLKDRAVAKPVDSNEFQESLVKAIDEVKNRGKFQGFIKVEKPLLIKTAGNMSLAGNVSGQIPAADREPGITQQLMRMFTIRNRSNVFATTSNYVEWVEQRNRDGAAAFTAEGGAKPQIDWDYIVNHAHVENLPAITKVTKQMLMDIPGMQGEINTELLYQVNLAEETQFLTGNGSSPNINGIDVYATALDNASIQYTIPNPNMIDALAAAITQIKTNTYMNFMPNVILLNPIDAFKLLYSNKTSYKEYIYPVTLGINPLSPSPIISVGGIPVIETNSVAAGTFYVCDLTKYNIRDYETLNIELGYENDDFTKNFVTVRAEKRLATYVKTQHIEAFVKSTFAAAMTYIDKAGS